MACGHKYCYNQQARYRNNEHIEVVKPNKQTYNQNHRKAGPEFTHMILFSYSCISKGRVLDLISKVNVQPLKVYYKNSGSIVGNLTVLSIIPQRSTDTHRFHYLIIRLLH